MRVSLPVSGHRRARRRAWKSRRVKIGEARHPLATETVRRLLGAQTIKRVRREYRLYGSPLAVNPHPYWSTR